MKHTRRCIALGAALLLTALPALAKTYFFTSSDGEQISIDIDDETVEALIEENHDAIQEAITENDVTAADWNEYKDDIETEVANVIEEMKSSNITFDYTELKSTINNTMNAMAGNLMDTLSAGQVGMHQWAPAYIGQIIPGPHFGFGSNTNLVTLDIKPIKSAIGDVMDMLSDVQSTTGSSSTGSSSFDDLTELLEQIDVLPLPTHTFDVRAGGFILPFDAGFTVTGIDTGWFKDIDDGVDEVLNTFAFNYFAIGGDVRYALVKDMPLGFTVAATGGYYFTHLALGVDKSTNIGANLEANVNTFTLGAQASAKLLIFVPYFGARALFTFGNVNWAIDPDWAALIKSGDMDEKMTALVASMLPTFGGTVSYGFFDHVRPQIYGGLALDMGPVDLTLGASYTFVSNVFGANLSLRFAI